MKIKSGLFVAAVCGMASVGNATESVAPSFENIAKELKFGGEYYSVVDAKTFRSDITKTIDLVANCIEEIKPYTAKAKRIADRLGLLSLRGYGESVHSVAPGVYEHRSFTAMDPTRTPLSDLVFSGPARMSIVENYLPDSAILALSFSCDISSVLPATADCIDIVEPGQGVEALNMVRMVAPFIDCIGEGTALAVTLDEARIWSMPDFPDNVNIPAPGVLLVQKVENDLPWKALVAALDNGESVPYGRFAGVVSIGAPQVTAEMRQMRIDPVFAYDAANGVLLAANARDVLDRALAAGLNGSHRLLQDATFLASAGELQPHNAMAYFSPKLLPKLCELACKAITDEEKKEIPEPLLEMLENPPSFWFVAQTIRRDNGFAGITRASFGACTTLRLIADMYNRGCMSIVPISAGVLLPAFTHARNSLIDEFVEAGEELDDDDVDEDEED